MKTTINLHEWCSKAEAAFLINRSVRTVERLTKSGALIDFKIGHSTLINRKSIKDYKTNRY
jgi:hypothetical protein